MPTVVRLNSDNFDRFVGSADLVIIAFHADWCAPCRRFAPLFDRAAEQHPEISFAKVDIEAEPELKDRFEITGVPTLIVMRQQSLVWRQWGAFPHQELEQLISQAKANEFPSAA
jgi:thioredoxin 1